MEGYDFTGRKILIVEDDFSSRLYLNKLLEKTGIEIINASNGKEAFDMVIKNFDIDIVLMDIQLPVMDGYTCTKLLRESGFSAVIIAQTAYGLTSDKERIMASGFDDYLIKPISQKQLLGKLSDFLR